MMFDSINNSRTCIFSLMQMKRNKKLFSQFPAQFIQQRHKNTWIYSIKQIASPVSSNYRTSY